MKQLKQAKAERSSSGGKAPRWHPHVSLSSSSRRPRSAPVDVSSEEELEYQRNAELSRIRRKLEQTNQKLRNQATFDRDMMALGRREQSFTASQQEVLRQQSLSDLEDDAVEIAQVRRFISNYFSN